MGLLRRLIEVNRPRQNRSGDVWDNVNTPGGKGYSAPSGRVPLVRPRGVVRNPQVYPLPNVQFNLRGVNVVDPGRLHSQANTMLPQIPVREPAGGIGFGFSYDTNSTQATANPTVLSTSNPLGIQKPAVAPTQVRARENEYDAGSFRNLQRFYFITPSQQYFNQRTPLPEFTTPSTFSHQVYTNVPELRRGWEQALVPEPGMRFDEVGTAPPTLLSTPLNVRTIIRGGDGHRSPIKNVKAPKRVRSGG